MAKRLPVSPADYEKLIAEETEKWGKVIQPAKHQGRNSRSVAPKFHKYPFREWLVSVCVDDLIE